MNKPMDNNSQFSLKEAAIAFHEFFTSYIDAGFTRAEALQLVMNHQQIASEQARETKSE